MLWLALGLITFAGLLWLWGMRTRGNDGSPVTQTSSGPNSPNLTGTFHGDVIIHPPPEPKKSAYDLSNIGTLERALTDAAEKHSAGLREFSDPLAIKKEISVQSKGTATESHVEDRAVDRDTPLREALAYAAFGDWSNRPIAEFESGDSDKIHKALQRFHQLASDGVLRVWGIQNGYNKTNVLVKIPPTHWGYAEVEYLDALREKPSSRSKVPGAIDYADIHVNRAEFEEHWPHD